MRQKLGLADSSGRGFTAVCVPQRTGAACGASSLVATLGRARRLATAR